MVFILPLPNEVNEVLSAEIMTSLALNLLQALLDNGLGGNTGVITTGQPESGLSVHTGPSNHGILERVAKGVTHVQSTRNVGRGDNDCEVAFILDGAIGLELRLEEAFLLPPLVPCALDGDGVVGLELGIVEGLESLLLADRGIFDVLGQRLLDGLRGLLLLRLASSLLGLCLGLGLLLLSKFGVLLGLLALPLYYDEVQYWAMSN